MKGEFDLLCLDSKERLYLILKQYGWLEEFFRHFPQHFYENSFVFVDMIPQKKLYVKVKVIGLGIAGSLAVSGLAKLGIEHVIGYEQRQRSGPGGATSRYQNASWRAYDISEKLLNQEAYDHLRAYRQKIKVQYDDGSSKIVVTDRVQIIIGDAVNSALDSAARYGAKLCFGFPLDSYDNSADKRIISVPLAAIVTKIAVMLLILSPCFAVPTPRKYSTAWRRKCTCSLGRN
jgi:hypothetical protein